MNNKEIQSRVKFYQQKLVQLAADNSRQQIANLLVVTKGQSSADIVAAYHSGCRHFAESTLQALQQRLVPLQAKYPDMVLHFIGHLQSNKISRIVSICDYIHSVDRLKLLEVIASTIKQQKKRSPRLFIQVNIADEPQKSGAKIDDLAGLLLNASRLSLQIVGLMCIPPRQSAEKIFSPAKESVAEAKDHSASYYFKQLQNLALQFNLPELSMGMTADFQDAVKFGSSWVRIGRGIFSA